MKYIIITVILLVIGVIGYFFMSSDDNLNSNVTNIDINNQENNNTYINIDPAKLSSLIDTEEDLFLLDVHTPEQVHIDNTDAFVPYDLIENNMSELPEDKTTPIVVYCRSGSMSKIASDKLIDLGYTNVSNLEGGINAWNIFSKK